MIRFDLICDKSHRFDAWFGSGDAYDNQAKRGLVVCPHCGSSDVKKALMAPAVATARKTEKVSMASAEAQKQALKMLQNMAREARQKGEYVGDKFAQTAREIHEGWQPERGIYGEATSEEVKGLIDDGISVLPMPELPEDKN